MIRAKNRPIVRMLVRPHKKRRKGVSVKLPIGKRNKNHILKSLRRLSLAMWTKLMTLATRKDRCLCNKTMSLVLSTNRKSIQRKDLKYKKTLLGNDDILIYWFQLDRNRFFKEMFALFNRFCPKLLISIQNVKLLADNFHTLSPLPRLKFSLDEAEKQKVIPLVKTKLVTASFPYDVTNHMFFPIEPLSRAVLLPEVKLDEPDIVIVREIKAKRVLSRIDFGIVKDINRWKQTKIHDFFKPVKPKNSKPY